MATLDKDDLTDDMVAELMRAWKQTSRLELSDEMVIQALRRLSKEERKQLKYSLDLCLASLQDCLH